MSLTEEELNELKLECANAKVRCKETWQVLLALKKITKTYSKIHGIWSRRYEKADRKIAMEEKITKVNNKMEKQSVYIGKLTKEQLLAIIKELE